MDPVRAKAQQKKAWDQAAAGWKKWWPRMEGAMQPVTDALLEMAKISEGQWVLDVATGLGEPALSMAKVVGKQGKVVGIDQAKKMLHVAEERAKELKLDNASFQELDAEGLGAWPRESYEAALCRFGLMFMPQVGTALRGIHHVLTKGGWLAASVWGPPEKVPFITVAQEVYNERLALPAPEPGTPGPFALAESGILEQALSSAGFKDIRGERVTVVWEFDSAEQYAEHKKDTSIAAQVVSEAAPSEQAALWRAVAEAAAKHAGPDGKISLVCEARCVAARKG